jgi:hypothetical protein
MFQIYVIYVLTLSLICEQMFCQNWSINELIPKDYDPKKLPFPNGYNNSIVRSLT